MPDCQEFHFFRRVMVFDIVLGIRLIDFRKALVVLLKKCHVPIWNIRLRLIRLNRILDMEIFIWIWKMTEFYGNLYFSKKGVENERGVFRELHNTWFREVAKEETYPRWRYDSYNDCISKLVHTPFEDYWRPDYDIRVKDSMIRMFSLVIVNRLYPESEKMGVDDINERYGDLLLSIQEEERAMLYSSLEILRNCFEEFDENQIHEMFEKNPNNKIVISVIDKLINA